LRGEEGLALVPAKGEVTLGVEACSAGAGTFCEDDGDECVSKGNVTEKGGESRIGPKLDPNWSSLNEMRYACGAVDIV
jgi:hypothetical protein